MNVLVANGSLASFWGGCFLVFAVDYSACLLQSRNIELWFCLLDDRSKQMNNRENETVDSPNEFILNSPILEVEAVLSVDKCRR